MHYVQKYMEKLPLPKVNVNTNVGGKANIYLYCNYYSFYSQKYRENQYVRLMVSDTPAHKQLQFTEAHHSRNFTVPFTPQTAMLHTTALWHNIGDGTYIPLSEVLMALYEKNVDFEPLIVDITKGEQYSSWFLEINPRGEIPVLKIKNEIIPDSTRILDHLEFYLDEDLLPLINVSTDSKVINNIHKFRELFEALPAGLITVGSFFHPQLCGSPKLPFILPVREVLKNGDLSNSTNLRKLAEENPQAKSILLYKAQIQDRKHEIITNEEEYIKVLNIIDQVLTQVEEQLKIQPEENWLCCEHFTIADINLAVLLQRLWELGFEGRYWAEGKRPFIENYFNRVKERESFKRTIPNLPVHIKMIVTSQPPAYLGAAGAASIGVVLACAYIVKKIIN